VHRAILIRKSKIKPPLLAFVICEKALLDEDKVVSLIRIVDTFTLNLEIGGGSEEELREVAVELNCTVFTRWGPGEGQFTEELRLVMPDGREMPGETELPFTNPPGLHFQQIRHDVRLGVRDSGIYKFRVYLDGKLIGEHPFRVEVNKKRVQGTELESH
jgi:hypothetical protein